MPATRFKLESIVVEGFKAFTSEQVIHVGGKHLFLFGENGTGKSSVVEAIRWCLFGLAERPETEVRNVFYPPGECRVELKLSCPQGTLTVVRKLRPGTGKSDLEIRDTVGLARHQREVLPHLARVGPKEGAHIILASQQQAARRPQADISEFDRVLYAYLGLEDVDDLARKVKSVFEEGQAELEKVADKLRAVREAGQRKVSEMDMKLEEVIRNRPWGSGEAPTYGETEAKIIDAVRELAELLHTHVSTDAPLSSLLTSAEQWIRELVGAEADKLRRVLAEKRDILWRLKRAWDDYRRSREAIRGLTEESQALQESLGDVSGGRTVEDLEQAIADRTARLQRAGLRAEIASRAAEYLRHSDASQCPVCLAEYSPGELADRVRQGEAEAAVADAEARELAAEREELERKREEVARLASKLEVMTHHLREEEAALFRTKAVIRGLLGLSEEAMIEEADIERALKSAEEVVSNLEQQLSSGSSLVDWWNTRIQNLRAELRYHDYRRQRDQLREILARDLMPAEDRYEELVDFLNSLAEINDRIDEEIERAVKCALPALEDQLTGVFRRLTSQRSFDSIRVEQLSRREKGETLRLRVASAQKPGLLFDPDDVLNGQASAALRLVPYFVFSRYQAEALDLDWLLIDDPSQSFDTSRVRLLMEELRDAATHAQLVVATHEVERFWPVIRELFHGEEIQAYRFAGFDRDGGPVLEPFDEPV